MKKLLLMLISFCGVLTACQRMPSKTETYTPIDTVGPRTDTLPSPDTTSSRIQRPNPGEYKLLYGVRPAPYEQKRLAEDSLKNAKE